MLATLFAEKGHVRVRDFNRDECGEVTMPCHDGQIGSMTMSRDGRVLATAVEKGMLIRLWDLPNSRPLTVLRRDDNSNISDIAFSAFSRKGFAGPLMFAVCSESQEVLVYDIVI